MDTAWRLALAEQREVAPVNPRPIPQAPQPGQPFDRRQYAAPPAPVGVRCDFCPKNIYREITSQISQRSCDILNDLIRNRIATAVMQCPGQNPRPICQECIAPI